MRLHPPAGLWPFTVTCYGKSLDKFDRIFQLHSILANRRTPIDVDSLMARLECSRATLYRIVQSMKDHLNAPIEFDAERGGFMYRRASGEETYELPGLWFSPAELQSLAVMQRILRDLGGGLLAEQVSAITKHSESARAASSTESRRSGCAHSVSRRRVAARG